MGTKTVLYHHERGFWQKAREGNDHLLVIVLLGMVGWLSTSFLCTFFVLGQKHSNDLNHLLLWSGFFAEIFLSLVVGWKLLRVFFEIRERR